MAKLCNGRWHLCSAPTSTTVPALRATRQFRRSRLICLSQQEPSSSQDSSPPSSSSPPAAPLQPVQWPTPRINKRRATVAGLAGAGIVLGSNFLGITSLLLSLDEGQLAGRLRLDSLVPVLGHKRCVDYQNGFEFLYPADWLADQRLYYRYAERVEQRAALDPPSLSSRRRMSRDYSEPAAAFGPPGSTGEENISVVVAPVRTGFRLQSMGSPEQAAAMFLENVFARPGSDKQGQLISATSRVDSLGQLYYVMEFTVRSPTFYRHNLAVYGARNDLLYTLNCQCPEERWAADADKYWRAADSFQILSTGAGAGGYPDQL